MPTAKNTSKTAPFAVICVVADARKLMVIGAVFDVFLAVVVLSFAQFLELGLLLQKFSTPARAAGHTPRAYGCGACGRRDFGQAAASLYTETRSRNSGHSSSQTPVN